MAEFPTMDEINASADPAPEPTAPAAAEPTAPAAAEPTAPAGHPWDADLAGLQLAPEHSKAVSDYLAAQWQPRMTQYEQDLKTWRDAFGGNEEHRDLGAKIIKNFTNDPENAFIEMGVELGYIDPAQLEGYEHLIPDGAVPAAADPQSTSGLSPEQQQLLDWAAEQKTAQETYNQDQALLGYYNQLATEAGITEDFNTDDFDVLFSGTRGNPEKAMELYIALHYDTSEAETSAPGVPAPPVLNDHTGGQAPPASEKYSSFDDAGKSLLAEIRASEGR